LNIGSGSGNCLSRISMTALLLLKREKSGKRDKGNTFFGRQSIIWICRWIVGSRGQCSRKNLTVSSSARLQWSINGNSRSPFLPRIPLHRHRSNKSTTTSRKFASSLLRLWSSTFYTARSTPAGCCNDDNEAIFSWQKTAIGSGCLSAIDGEQKKEWSRCFGFIALDFQQFIDKSK